MSTHDVSFADLALHTAILKALEEGGYSKPTPVQAASIPSALQGRDLLATAETGTGKTAAFLLPSLTRIANAPIQGRREAGSPRILILTPTRELSRQVLQSARKYGKFLRLHTVELVGGMPWRDQVRLLSRPVDVVVGTPGRLLDHLTRKRLLLDKVETLILDEADRMLDMGFLEDVQAISNACPTTRQTLLFTATLDKRMAALATNLLSSPERIEIASETTALSIEQIVHHSDDLAHKRRLLDHCLSLPELGKAIIFTATKRDADSLADHLRENGHPVAALHGDMNQRQRNRTLEQLRSGEISILVATDVAARGIDVKDITHVINFDLPRAVEDYVHRIGRTGRAGASGVAISFAGRSDRDIVGRIERYTQMPMKATIIPGLEPRFTQNTGKPSGARKPQHRFAGARGRSDSNSGDSHHHPRRSGPPSSTGKAKPRRFNTENPSKNTARATRG